MAIDPSIPLATDTQGIDVGKLMSGAQFALQMKQSQRQAQNQNALKAILSSPDAFDPQTSSLTPNALKQIMQVDPETGIKLQGDMLEQSMKRAQEHHYQSENGRMSFDAMTGIAGAAVDAYNDAKKNGAKEEDAISAAIKVRNAGAENSGGLLSDSDVDKLINSPFDPKQAEAFAGLNKEWSANRRATASEAERERHDQAMEEHGDKMIGVALSRIGQAEDNKWQILTDPKTNTQYRYNPLTGKATTLDGSSEYRPQGAAKLAGGTPRSAPAMFVQKYMEEHPDASADDIAKASSGFAMRQSEGRTVGTRSGAADVAAEDVNIFANQALDASKNLPRTDYALANEVLQNWDMKTNNPELRQLMIAADALVNSRARAISPTGSPHVNDQLEGRKMLSAAFAKGDFEAAVEQMQKEAIGVKAATKATQLEILDGVGSKRKSLPQVKSSSDYEGLKSGDHYLDPDGKERVKK